MYFRFEDGLESVFFILETNDLELIFCKFLLYHKNLTINFIQHCLYALGFRRRIRHSNNYYTLLNQIYNSKLNSISNHLNSFKTKIKLIKLSLTIIDVQKFLTLRARDIDDAFETLEKFIVAKLVKSYIEALLSCRILLFPGCGGSQAPS